MTRAALGALLALTLALDGCGRYGPPERIRKPAEPARSEAKPSGDSADVPASPEGAQRGEAERSPAGEPSGDSAEQPAEPTAPAPSAVEETEETQE